MERKRCVNHILSHNLMDHFVGMRERRAEAWARWRGLVPDQMQSGTKLVEVEVVRVKGERGQVRCLAVRLSSRSKDAAAW